MVNSKQKIGIAFASLYVLGAVNVSHAQESTIEFGGYIKLDALISRYGDGDPGAGTVGRDFYIPGAVPVGGESQSARTDMHMKETRLFVRGNTDVGEGNSITSYVEVDFLTGSDGDE